MKLAALYPSLLLLLSTLALTAACEGSKGAQSAMEAGLMMPPSPSAGETPIGGTPAGGTSTMNAGVDGPPTPTPTPTPPPTPARCEPAAEAVPILPRSSNHEVWRLYSDLLMAPIDTALFAQWTPLAQVRGFDHMTESRVDPQTLEEQLRTTEAIAELLARSPEVMSSCPAPQAQTPLCPLHASYDARAQFSNQQGADCWSYLDGAENPLVFDPGPQRWMSHTQPGTFIWQTGLHPGESIDVIRRWVAPVDGEVTLQGTVADADPGGGDGVTAIIYAHGERVYQSLISNGGAPISFNISVWLPRGEEIDFVIQRNEHNSWDSTALYAVITLTPSPSTAGLDWATCGAGVVNRVASRAWRRPLRAEELEDLHTVFTEVASSAAQAGTQNSFMEALKATLQAALLSPHVQYKPEFVPGGTRPEEEAYRRASRLALFFRGSFPDDELWRLAESGPLSDTTLAAQASRLLAEDGGRFVDQFGGQWLNFRGLIAEGYTPLARSMRQEAHDVFEAILMGSLPATRLLAPGFTIVDGRLAEHYGLGANPEAPPELIMTAERGGIFEQGHFLTATSLGSDFKRVIHRGIYALNRALCSTVPPLDPATLEEIAATAETIDPALPLSERMALHRESTGRCMGCHSQMDPLGLALEHFDAEGRWREAYPDGSPVGHSFDFNGTSVRNPTELKRLVIESGDYQFCVAEKLFTYGLYRAFRDDELCLITQLAGLDQPERSLHDLAIDAFLTSLAQTETP